MTKLKIYIALGVFILSLFGTIGYLRDQLIKTKSDRDRISSNFSNVTTELQKKRNEIGQLTVSYGVLELREKEAKAFNSDLMNEITDLNIKLKNARGVTKIEYRYIIKIDSIPVLKTSDTTFIASYKDDWIALTQNITLRDNKDQLTIDSLDLQVNDGLIIVDETQYRRYWIFWRKPTGSKIHIKSDNPYIDIDSVQTINFIRKPKKRR